MVLLILERIELKGQNSRGYVDKQFYDTIIG